MPHCAAFGCSFQTRGNKDSDVSMHSFPSDRKRRAEWEKFCGRTELPKDPRLCSQHFSLDSYESHSRPRLLKELIGVRGFNRRLKPHAVPTILPQRAPIRHRLASEKHAEKFRRKTPLGALLHRRTLPTASSAPPVERGTSGTTLDTAEANYTPVHGDPPPVSVPFSPTTVDAATQTVSVQFSPTTVGAATQTDVITSDASVQWPGDVPIIKDHIYFNKMLEKSQEEDCQSQDMFLSDDASEGSRAQYGESDPEYSVGSSELSQGTQGSQASTDTQKKDRLFLVSERQLKQLVNFCFKCSSPIVKKEMKELENDGSQLTLDLSCVNGCNFIWQSQPTLGGTKAAGDLLLAASVFLSGIHFAKFERFCHNMNLKTISEDTYTKLRKTHVFPVIEKAWFKEQNALLKAMKFQEEVVLCGDGRRDSPGHSAKYCTYTLLDVQSHKVVDFKVISCTKVSSSNTMEIRGFKEALKSIEEKGVRVTTISTDRHPQIVKEMRVCNPEIQHQFDPWHVAKGVSKELAAAARSRECEGLSEWIPSIINHLWWSAQTCEGDADLLREKWVSVIHHVTNRHDWPGNRRYHQCAHDPLDETSQRRKRWLRPGSEAHNAIVRTVKNKQLLKDLEHLTKSIHATALEVYHSLYLQYLPKRTHFGYDVMVHASMLAALDHNNNANREQAVYQDGESVREPLFKISWSTREFGARPVPVKKDCSYMTAMVADVLSSVCDSSESMDTRVSQTLTIAPQERPRRSHFVVQTQEYSRFR